MCGQAQKGCSSLQEAPEKESYGTCPIPGSGTTCPCSDPEPEGQQKGPTNLGFMPRAQSQFAGTDLSLFLAQQVA